MSLLHAPCAVVNNGGDEIYVVFNLPPAGEAAQQQQQQQASGSQEPQQQQPAQNGAELQQQPSWDSESPAAALLSLSSAVSPPAGQGEFPACKCICHVCSLLEGHVHDCNIYWK